MSILVYEDTVSVTAVKRFVAHEHLVEANVGWMGDNFKKLFLDNVEENVPAGRVAIHALVESSLDPEIMVELGRARRVIHLSHFFQLMKKQAVGQAGPLMINDNWNIAYCIGSDGNIWAVNACWYSFNRDWGVEGGSVGYPREWCAGSQVLSQAD